MNSQKYKDYKKEKSLVYTFSAKFEHVSFNS